MYIHILHVLFPLLGISLMNLPYQVLLILDASVIHRGYMCGKVKRLPSLSLLLSDRQKSNFVSAHTKTTNIKQVDNVPVHTYRHTYVSMCVCP